jgi:hypothetical protein
MSDNPQQTQPSLHFSVGFEDGSIFVLPQGWSDAFIVKFGSKPAQFHAVEQQLRFIAGKYYEHQAFPSKFDGIMFGNEPEGYDPDSDSRYDFDEYYLESWGEGFRDFGNTSNPPSLADIGEGVMYQVLRTLLMQAAIKSMGSEIAIMTPEDFLSGKGQPEP